MHFDLRKHTHLLVVGGSRAYGMHKTTSDVDVKGVAVPPKESFFGNTRRFEQADKPIPLMLAFFDGLDDKDNADWMAGNNLRQLLKGTGPAGQKLSTEQLLALAQQEVAKLSDKALGLFTPEERAAIRSEKLEGTVFNLVKFVGLAVEANPNIFDVLFCRDEEVRLLTPVGRKLREHRDLFVSARARFSFAGYAHAQLKRIKLHRAHLLNKPTHQPTRAEFGLPETTLIPADHLAAVHAAVKKKMDSWQFDFSNVPAADVVRVENQIADHLTEIQTALGYETVEDAKWMAAARTIGLNDNLIYLMQKEREYEAAHRRWKQYKDWETNRNDARFELEAKYGFDTKHGAHLVRLLKMCREILTTGEVNVWRGAGGPDDAKELLAIRNGEWTYDQVVEWSEKEDAELEAIYKGKSYVIPKEPDREAVDNLCVELVEEALRG